MSKYGLIIDIIILLFSSGSNIDIKQVPTLHYRPTTRLEFGEKQNIITIIIKVACDEKSGCYLYQLQRPRELLIISITPADAAGRKTEMTTI